MRFLKLFSRRLAGERGQSVIEALMAVAVLGIAAETTAILVQTMAKQTVANRDRAFATEKALQMLEELRELVLTDNENLNTLDGYSDGYCDTCTPPHPFYKWTLTTKYDVTNNTATGTAVAVPDWQSGLNPHSSNPLRPNQGYAFCRYVSITSSTTDPNMRIIYVRVYAAASNPGYASSTQTAMPASPQQPPLAEVFGLVHSHNIVNNPNQVLDLYFVALENVPGWWTRISDLVPMMEQSVISLQAENPGLVVRSHWIQTLSYGRDLEYTPETNAALSSVTLTGSLKKAYVYPGYADYDLAGSDDYYYNPSWFLGRLNEGGTLSTSSSFSATNLGYAMADQFNHAMRWPDEQGLYNVLTEVAHTDGVPAPQMSWRMLLEELNEDAPAVQNAVVLNLHGEMAPVPPLRNYSDGAKDPEYFYTNYATNGSGLLGARSFRATSQPERLWYSNAAGVTMGVNVYAWDANPNEITCDTCAAEVINDITLFIPGASLSNLSAIYRTQGNSQQPYYRFAYYSGAPCPGCTAPGSGPFVVPAAGEYSDSASLSTATFLAQTITARSTVGLRIELFGTTPTARVYAGTEYSSTVSP